MPKQYSLIIGLFLFVPLVHCQHMNERNTDKETERQRQTDRQAGKQTNRQTYRDRDSDRERDLLSSNEILKI